MSFSHFKNVPRWKQRTNCCTFPTSSCSVTFEQAGFQNFTEKEKLHRKRTIIDRLVLFSAWYSAIFACSDDTSISKMKIFDFSPVFACSVTFFYNNFRDGTEKNLNTEKMAWYFINPKHCIYFLCMLKEIIIFCRWKKYTQIILKIFLSLYKYFYNEFCLKFKAYFHIFLYQKIWNCIKIFQ